MSSDIKTKAEEARKWFKTTKRGEDEIWVKKPDAPSWIRDLAYKAHDDGGILPDDWVYSFIVESLDALSEYDDPDEIELEADIYTSDLTAWLNSHNGRVDYLSDALNDGGAGDGTQVLSLAQLMEKEAVLSSVRGFLEGLDLAEEA